MTNDHFSTLMSCAPILRDAGNEWSDELADAIAAALAEIDCLTEREKVLTAGLLAAEEIYLHPAMRDSDRYEICNMNFDAALNLIKGDSIGGSKHPLVQVPEEDQE